MNARIAKYLLKCGIKPHLQGFIFINEAIKILMENKESKMLMIKKIYPEVAKRYNVTAMQVERNIRNAIEKANKEYKMMTNSEFIAISD